MLCVSCTVRKSQGTVFFPKSKIIKQEVYLCGQTNCLRPYLKKVLEGRPSNKLVHWFVGAQEILETWDSKYALGYLHILLNLNILNYSLWRITK